MRWTATAAAVTAALLATMTAGGCASRDDVDSGNGHVVPAATHLPPVSAKNDCIDFAAAVRANTNQGRYPTPGDLPAQAHPASLLRCVEAPQDIPGQGQWWVVNTVRSTGSVDGFVSALRASYVKAPQPTPHGKIACPAIGYSPEWIALIDADGTAYQIRIPSWGVCGQPDTDVLKALGTVRGSDHVVEVRSFSHMIEPRRWSPAS
jgi:hypothetical protein